MSRTIAALKPDRLWLWAAVGSLLLLACGLPGCGSGDQAPPALKVPRGYLPILEIERNGRLLGFGPFVGYYFKPETRGNLQKLRFICFNERSFYTRDLPENTELFRGEAVLTRLADVDFDIPAARRINPVYFTDAPVEWTAARPEPKDEFVHFHSCYDAQGPVLAGYWIRHTASAAFTYDMGRRVGPDSSLYHPVGPGPDRAFARIIEFDRGPQ